MVVRNLTAQGYEEETPPSSSEFGNDENVATETRYDVRGRAIATIEWWVEASEPVSRTTRSYYDAVGNRLSEATDSGTVEYEYDVANRLEYVDGQPYTWDDNGNLLDDGVNTYTYDQANRLASVSSTEYEVEYGYNGLGDRLSQTVDSETTTYTLNLVGGLTQVLADDTYTYLYGTGRIAQFTGANTEYFLGDALGSVRQLVDENGDLTLARGYEPYGEVLEAGGEASSSYGFTGEWTDITGLVNLRARYYAPQDGRFLTRDTWRGDQQQPMSYNAWLYVYANPVNLTDPGGMCPDMNRDGKCDKTWECDLMPSPYREWCWGELGCGGSGAGGTMLAQVDCDALPGTAPAICKTYLALRDHPGWWTRGTWNGNRPGPLSPQAFLGLVLRMEFNASGGFNKLKPIIQQETTVRNFYYVCSGLPGNTCNPRSADDIFIYIDWKRLLYGARQHMILPQDADFPTISAEWVDNPLYYSNVDFECPFLNPGTWLDGYGPCVGVTKDGRCLYTAPMDWGNLSMITDDDKYQEAYELIISGSAQGLAEDHFYIVGRGRPESNFPLIYTLSQLRYWRGAN